MEELLILRGFEGCIICTPQSVKGLVWGLLYSLPGAWIWIEAPKLNIKLSFFSSLFSSLLSSALDIHFGVSLYK